MSVDLEQLMARDGLDFDTQASSPEHWIVRLIAGEMRELSLLVGSDPKDYNPYHAQVWGIGSKKLRRKIMKRAQILSGGLTE